MTPEDINAIVEIINTLNIAKPNELLPVYATLGGAAIGAIASIIPTFFIERYREQNFSKQIKKCIIAEISAILRVAEQRKYLEHLQGIVNYLKLNPNESCKLVVDIPAHYSRVYQENCKHLGVINSKSSRDIIVFYQLIDALVQDIKPNGAFGSNQSLRAYEEDLRILTDALDIARKLEKSI